MNPLSAPQMAGLSATKRKLLDQYLRGEVIAAGKGSRNIVARPHGGPAPLSLAVEQIWRRAQASAGRPAFYNESLTVHREGPLDACALQWSLAEFIRRHEIWRTTFDTVNGCPVQVIHRPPASIPLTTADLRGCP